MSVRIDEAGQQGGRTEVDDASIPIAQSQYFGARTYGDDAISGNRDCFRAGPRRRRPRAARRCATTHATSRCG